MATKQKLIIIGSVTFLIGTVGITTIYLPFMTVTAQLRKQEILRGPKTKLETVESIESPNGTKEIVSYPQGGSRGSMWSNAEKVAKSIANKEDEK